MKRYIFTLLLTCFSSISFSQIHEVGFFLGGSNIIGDIGASNYVSPNQIAGGLVYKYNLNPRIAIRGNYNYIPVSAADIDSDNLFRQQRNFSISNTIHELAVGLEFNFFDYNIRIREQSFTPYILAQVAANNYQSPDRQQGTEILFTNKFSYAIPVGVGVKGRISDHLAYGLEVAVRLTFDDDLDYTVNDIPVLDFGGNGNDFYTFAGFSIVYTFGRPACYADQNNL
ncbi:type IX secretion system protein PorG [Tenacibaculum jejuense]|uniref:DUF6089 domain-containing protein n=1 Tax=Tenacibaculum jejuense TaxID=584609 RepID=A0A238U7E2_9FLAO|nr:DUF6089 family protein [Tenacibaculum jejuense]SNR14518.1 conserved exported protein of unknown function [Tenacibaculum jejuense]